MNVKTGVLAALLGGLALAACATTAPPSAPEAVPAPVPAPASETPPPVPDAVPPPKPKPDPKALIGLSPADTLLMLDVPDMVRRDDHVQVHQYRVEACVMDLVFYEEPDGPFALGYVNVRDPMGKPADAPDCLELIIDRAAAKRAE